MNSILRTLLVLVVLTAAGFAAAADSAEVAATRKKAEAGDSEAQFNLGTMYFLGEVVPRDTAEAVKWLRKAADQGKAVAQNNLGTMYILGVGVPKDLVQAHAWYNIAGAGGNADADYYAAQGSATRHFWWGEARALLTGWRLSEVSPLASFEYFASGGFSGPQIGGRWLQRALRSLDRVAALWPRALAARLIIVLAKTPG